MFYILDVWPSTSIYTAVIGVTDLPLSSYRLDQRLDRLIHLRNLKRETQSDNFE